MSILRSFPYPTPRPGQLELLQAIEQNWDRYDIFVIVAPTAFGKTSVIRTLQQWQYSVSAITPTNLLVNQFISEFPDAHTLHRMDSYHCGEWERPCSITRAKQGGFCRGCTCSADLARAKYKQGPGIYNYHIQSAHQLHRRVLVVDEAHNLARTIQDKLSHHIWWHDYKYPQSMQTNEQIRKWIEKLPANQQKHKKIVQLYNIVTDLAPTFVVQRGTEMFNGKGTTRGFPEERDCLKFYPVNITEAPPFYWPQGVEKIVLMSATISHVDIKELGLDRRRVLYLQAASPIPAINRPVQSVPVVDLNHENLEGSIPRLAEEINNIASYHADEKGLVHVTYRMAELLIPYLTDSRFIFHDKENKTEQYEYFRKSKDPRILVACGMYEGIDLPGDLGRWQVIAKCPWKSLGDPAIAYKSEHDGDWYTWQALRDLIQACGRVCRTETDYGATYILDKSVERLLEQGDHLVPQWFRDALDAGRN